jgi:hypothetical protein
MIEVELVFARKIPRRDADLAVGARAGGDVSRKIDRARHDETVIVIRMFADQIDASGRAKDARRPAVSL